MKHTKPIVLFMAVLVVLVLLLAAFRSQSLERVPQEPPLARIIDSTSAVTCYLVRQTGQIQCVPWGRR